MLCALKYVHSANVLHRDLKPSNILVNQSCDLQICGNCPVITAYSLLIVVFSSDFGLARGVEEHEAPHPGDGGQASAAAGLTLYVVTRWYRAPELLLAGQYTKAIDVWAVGCILAEMLGSRPLFPGDNYIHQLKIIMDVVGSPGVDKRHFITNNAARQFIDREPHKQNVPFSTLFPTAAEGAIDLLEKMLTFSPEDRISVDEALDHPYFNDIRDEEVEFNCESHFNCEWEHDDLTKERLQELLLEESVHYHPEHRQDLEAWQEYQRQQQKLGPQSVSVDEVQVQA